MLLMSGMDPNTQNNKGNTALHYACDTINMKIVDLLMDYGAREDIENNSKLFDVCVQKPSVLHR